MLGKSFFTISKPNSLKETAHDQGKILEYQIILYYPGLQLRNRSPKEPPVLK